MINVTEVFEEVVKTTSEKSSGNPQIRTKKKFSTREILINEDYIVRIIPHEYTSSVENEMLVEAGLERKNFSRIIMDGKNFINSEIVILSSLYDIEKALK